MQRSSPRGLNIGQNCIGSRSKEFGPPAALKIASRSTATVAHHIDQLTQGLSEALKTLVLGLVPCIVQGHPLWIYQNSAHIAAGGTAGKLSHAFERAA